jgi:hypothetical protein
MKKMFFCLAALAAIAFGSVAARAADTLIYSMETGTPANPDGFGPNGGGVTISQDTFGATQGTHSLKYSVITPATFVGALTTNLPAILNNPPGVNAIKFDMTIGPNDAFLGNFDVIGITVFGFNSPLGQFGLQAQFAPLVHVEGKGPGTYTDLTIPLTGATNPLNFNLNQSFNDIFTAGTPDANHLNPAGFEFFLNKSGDAPSTVYIDNVRLVVPEPASCALLGIGAVGLVALYRRRSR